MASLEIRNLGPVKNVDLVINTVNVIIGPQSSGKSTIAKVISFCQWLEKDALFHQGTEHIDLKFAEEMLFGFHKLTNYVGPDTCIRYTGRGISFVYDRGEVKAETLEGFNDGKAGKVAYIPAERNLVTLRGIQSLQLPYNNIRSFLFDWLSIHDHFLKDTALSILDLNVRYYYDSIAGTDKLVLGDGKELLLDEASSGMQSLIPLYVCMKYLTEWIYSHTDDLSYSDKEKYEILLAKKILDDVHIPEDSGLKRPTDLNEVKAMYGKPTMRNALQAVISSMRVLRKYSKEGENDRVDSFARYEDYITRPHYTSLIVEEPELNLFPSTQAALLYDMINMIGHDRDMLVITTHSPYILYALNNCMLRWLVRDTAPEDAISPALRAAAIDPSIVSVWEMRDGHFDSPAGEGTTIQDKRGLIRQNYFDRVMKNIMADFNNMINFYD